MRGRRGRGKWVVVVLAGVALAGLPGCLGGGHKASLDDLFISERRFNIDESRGLVRVYGRLENTGDSRFRAVEVHATLLSAGNDKRGENSVLLEKIQPREKRNFSLLVTSHARTHDVLLEIRAPEKP